MRDFSVLSNQLSCGDTLKDFKNPDFLKMNLIKKKFQDDIISRLAELAHKSFGKVNFYFAIKKMKALELDFYEFEKFIVVNKFKAKRDEFISHKKQPPTLQDGRAEYRISYCIILKGIAKAMILMKRIDRIHIGEYSDLKWEKVRRKRYDYSVPAKITYKLMPFVRI
jgi:hypothetical protein